MTFRFLKLKQIHLLVIFVFALSMVSSCSRRDEINPIVEKSNIFRKKTKKITMRYPLTPEDVGSFEFKDVAGSSPRNLKKLRNFFKNITFTFNQMGVKWLKMGKLKISTNLDVPSFDEEYLHGVTMKRIVLALIPCQKGKCGARARPFTNSFINSAFLSLSVFPNETVDNKKTEVDLSNRDLRRIRREEQKNKPTENFEINKVSKGVFNSKSRLAKKMIEFSRASEFPMDILRLTREKKSNSSFYVAYFNRTKPLFNHNKNIFVLPTHNKSNQLIGSLKDYFTNYAQGYDFKFYNVGERVFAESRKKDISGIDVKLELNESLNFIQQHTPSIIENNKRRVVGHDVISCQKNQCINFDVLNVELLPLFKAKHRLKVDTYIDINKIPKTDFIYVGFIEFEANIEIDLEI